MASPADGLSAARRRCTVLHILVTELCERFAFYGFVGSLTYFFMMLGMSSVLASELNQLFSAVVYVTPVIGAYVADVYLGRYLTILCFCVIYILGLVLTTCGAWPSDASLDGVAGRNASDGGGAPFYIDAGLSRALSLTGLFLCVSLGAGGIKSNVVVLGADQFELPRQAAEQAAFFNWFYWSINIGATAAYLFLTNIALRGLPSVGIPQDFGFFTSFCVPTVAFAFGVLTFRLGKRRYKMKPPEGSAVTTFLQTLSGACMRGRGRCLLGASLLLPLSFVLIVTSFFVAEGSAHDCLAVSGTGAIGISLVLLARGGAEPSWLYSSGGTRAISQPAERDAADVVRILPLAACVIVFWIIYSQMSSNFQLQGCQMDLNTFIKLSPATLNVFDSIVIMGLIPIVDRCLYPALRRCGYELSMVTKITIGFGFAGLSVICAGVVEILRKASPLIDGPQGLSSCPGTPRMSELSIWSQTPQYMLIGLGEIFAAITCYELFYSEVPAHMRSVCQSINLLCTAFGSLAAAGLNSIMATWIPDNLNHGHLEYVFFVLAVLMALNICAFVHLSASFDYRADLFLEELDTEHMRSADEEQSYTEVLQRDLRISGNGPLDFLEPGVFLGGRRSGTSRASSKRTTSRRSTAQSEHLDALLEGPRGLESPIAGI